MADASFLSWPFFEEGHRAFAAELERWAGARVPSLAPKGHGRDEVDAASRRLVRALGDAGHLAHVVPASAGGRSEVLDVRSLCLAREILARHEGLADFAFAMQGLGSGAISLFGTPGQQRRFLPPVRKGEAIAAFALSEPDAGSDVGAMTTRAAPDGAGGWVLDGTKTWISNAGLADFYVVFARATDAPGSKGLAAFVVDADAPGLRVSERIDVIAPHPLGTLRFEGCRVGGDRLLGKPGEGFRIAMSVLDVFRSTVGAAALGFARRALDEAIGRVLERKVFGQKLADYQLTQAKLADMAVAVDAAALLVYRAAWTKDTTRGRVTREASMAKLFATESAQGVIDQAVQLFGGIGVVSGAKVEELYREIRALRIYEGTSEIQKLVIASAVLERHAKG